MAVLGPPLVSGNRGGGGARKAGGGGGSWHPKVKSLSTKNSQINISFCKIPFFPTMKSGSEGGGGC